MIVPRGLHLINPSKFFKRTTLSKRNVGLKREVEGLKVLWLDRTHKYLGSVKRKWEAVIFESHQRFTIKCFPET